MSGIKSDKWIRQQCGWSKDGSNELILTQPRMIEPFVPNQVRVDEQGEKVISYGTSSYGYDLRCGREFKIFTNINNVVVDPKNFNEKSFVDHVGDFCIIPPNSFVLATSVETVNIPRDITAVCIGKSTYARVGVVANITPIESEFRGHITLEFSNTTPLPAKIYANEGIVQLLFFQADADDICHTSYNDRNGKYQGQVGITLPLA